MPYPSPRSTQAQNPTLRALRRHRRYPRTPRLNTILIAYVFTSPVHIRSIGFYTFWLLHCLAFFM